MTEHPWENLHQQHEWGTDVDKDFSKYLDGLDLKGSMRWLDLGCGTGAATLELVRRGQHVTAVDVSSTALRKLQAELPKGPGTAALILADITTLEFTPASFDFVVDANTLMIFPFKTAKSVVDKAHDWLRPNGRMYAKMACNTMYDFAINRSEFVRTTDENQLKSLWTGYRGKCFMSVAAVLMGGGYRAASHWVCHMEAIH